MSEENNVETVESLNQQIQDVMKKYKFSMYAIIALVVVYVICLFWIRNTWLTLIVCIPMIILAFYNNKLAKQIRTLASKRNSLQRMEKKMEREEAIARGEDVPNEEEEEAIVANAATLNDLPKEYTVLDDVELNGQPVSHIILSPYGIAIVNETNREDDIRAAISDLGIEPMIQYYEPTDNIAELAESIQMPKDICMTEQEIYKVLYRLTGLE